MIYNFDGGLLSIFSYSVLATPKPVHPGLRTAALTPSVAYVPSSRQWDFQSAPAWLPPGNGAQLGRNGKQATYPSY